MNSEIEQRIVAMYFDNKDFEKNAKQTIDTLGELKSNLNLENSVKGFDELDKAGKKLNLNQARTTVRNMKDSLSGMEGALKKAFDIGTAPLHALDNFFGTFRSYVGKFLGFDLASKFVNSLESALRQLTTAPIEAGWSMYQANVDSTKTIMSGTLKSYKEQMSKTSADWTYDEQEHMEFVKGQLAELSSYAQKTVFSLSDMTANVGKFTNNNIDLETSVTAMEGIANMTAKAGQGAQQASMAMYNFSQALGVGKMTTIDWKSIENANLATTELKQLFIDTATAAGKLTKEVTKTADGKELEKFFITVDKNGKKLAKNKWVEISAENFRDSLSNGWLDKETMLRVFQLYSNQVKDVDTLASWGFDTNNSELVEYLFGIGEEAEKAATQVRTFQKMWDAMTEAVQSGWADSMQYIFGDMLEATDFWTTINDKIGSVLDASAEKRNNLLREWRGMSFNEETQEWEKVEGAVDGREDLVQGIYGTIDALKSLGSAFRKAWSDVVGEMTGKRLQEITKGFRDLIDRFREWLGTTEDEDSRISKLTRALRGIFNIVKIVVNVIKAGFGAVKKLVAPVADIFINLFDKVFGFFDGFADLDFTTAMEKLKDGVIAAWEAIKGFFRPSELIAEDGTITYGDSPFTEALNSFFGGIADTIHGWMNDLGLQDLWGSLTNAWDWIKDIWNKITKWSGWEAIATFFVDTWTAIKTFFTPVEYESGEGEMNVKDSPFIEWITGLWDGIKGVWEKITGWGGWAAIGAFGTSVWSAIVNFFAPKEVKNARGETVGYADSSFISGIKGIWNKIKSAWNTITGWEGWATIGNFFSDIWGWITDKFNLAINWFSTPVEDGKTGFVLFIESFAAKVSSIWGTITGWEGWATIGNFFGNIWNWIKEKAGAAIDWFSKPVEDGKTGFVLFIEEFASKVSSIWNTIVTWEGWATIGNFFGNIWNWIKEKAGAAIDWFSKPVEDGKTGFVLFLEEFAAKVSSIWNTISKWEGWSAIGEFFAGIWENILGFFRGNEEVVEVAEEAETLSSEAEKAAPVTAESVSLLTRIVDAVSGFVSRIAESLNGVVIPQEVTTFFTNALDVLKTIIGFIGDMLGHFNNIISGKGSASEWAVVIIVGIIALLEQIFSYRNNRNLAKIQTESIASKFMAMGIGLLAISAAISLLTTLDQGKMWSAVGAVAVIGGVLGAIVGILAKLTENKTGLAAVEGKTKIWEKVIGAVEKIGMIAVAMALLPNIIKAFGEAKKMAPELNGMDILTTMTGIAAFITATSLGLALVDRITAGIGISPVAAVKTSAAIVAFLTVALAGIMAISGIVNGLFGTDNAVQTLEDGGRLLSALGGALSGLIGGLIGGFAKGFNLVMDGRTEEQKLQDSLDILESLGDRLEVFTTDKTAGIGRILNLVGLLSQTMDDVPKATDFTKFTDSLEPLAASIMKFGLILSGFTIAENQEKIPLESMKERILALVEIMRAFDIPDFSTIVSSGRNKAQYFIEGIDYLSKEMTPERFEALGSFMANLVTAFNEAMDPESQAMKTMSGDLMKNLSAAIKIGLGEAGKYEVGVFDAMPIIDAITTALGYGETAVATAVHNMVQAGIDAQGKGQNKIDLNSSGLISGMEENDLVQKLMSAALGEDGSVSDATKDMEERLTSFLYGKGGSQESPSEDSLLGMLGGFSGELNAIEFPDIGERLKESLSFKDPETGEDMDLTGKLTEALGEVQEKINETSFEIKIVPVIDMSHMDTEALRKTIGDYPVRMPLGNYAMPDSVRIEIANLAKNIDLEGVRSDIRSVTTAVDLSRTLTVKAINAMADRIDNLGSDIARMKLYLDTGILVGGITPLIDRELGRRASAADTTGVSSIFGANYSADGVYATKD